MEKMEAYLARQSIDDTEFLVVARLSKIKKVTFSASEGAAVWRGEAPVITLQLDNINGFLLTTKFAINMKRTQLGNDHDTVEARSSDGAIPRI